MTRIAWGMMVLALAALLMITASQPAAAQQSSDQSMTGQPMTPQPEATQPEMTMPEAAPPAPAMPEAVTPAPSTMAGEYPNVASLQPFSPEANFMSVPGYLRWQVFRTQGTWLSYAEARRIVIAQGGRIYRAA